MEKSRAEVLLIKPVQAQSYVEVLFELCKRSEDSVTKHQSVQQIRIGTVMMDLGAKIKHKEVFCVIIDGVLSELFLI